MPTAEAPEETQVDDIQTDTGEKPEEDVADPNDEPAGGDSPAGESEWAFATAMQEEGYEVTGDFDPKSAFGEMAKLANGARYFQQQAEQNQQIITALQGQIAAAPQAPPTPQPAGEAKPEWTTFTDSYTEFIDSETNQFRPEAPPQVREDYAKYQAFAQQFRTNPYETLYDGIKDRILEDVRTEYETLSEKQQTTSSIDKFEQDNANWLYASDPLGNPIVNPVSGQRQFSQFGDQFGVHFKMLIGEGMEQGAAANVAMKLLASDVQQRSQQQAPQPTEEETADSRANLKKSHTDRIKRGGGRTSGSGGTSDSASGPNPVAQNGKSTSFKDTLRRNMAEAGITDSDVN